MGLEFNNIINIQPTEDNEGGGDSGGSGSSDDIIIPRELVDGVLKMPQTLEHWAMPEGATTIGEYALYESFCYCPSLKTVDLSSITTLNGSCYMAFGYCTNLESVDLSGLTNLNNGTLQQAFYGCTKLTNVNFANLVSATKDNAMNNIFARCTGLKELRFPKLRTVSGSQTFMQAFDYCEGLEIYFPAMKSVASGSFANAFPNGSNNTVHFPSNLSNVGNMGNAIVLYDLPAVV